MRTIVRETASQVAPRNCSKEIRGEVSIYVILVWGRGEICAIKYTFWQKVAARHQGHMSLLMILVLL